MVERIFELWPIIAIVAGGTLAFAIGAIMGGLSGQDTGPALLRGFEGAILAVAGGLLARAFISILLGLAHDSPGARLFVGWAFFLIPGAVDTIPTWLGSPIFGVNFYLWLATAVGLYSGLMDGIYRIYNWKGSGIIAFVIDHTWGLAGTTTGCLIHLFNLFFGEHTTGASEERKGAHRYRDGFRFKKNFAVTQGAVMSGMNSIYDKGTPSERRSDHHPRSELFRHERVHVTQNRIFGPLFTLLYLAWMPLFFVPGLIAAKVKKLSAEEGVMWYAYYNNPYEVWAYRFGGWRDPKHALCWGAAAALATAIPFSLIGTALLALWAWSVWN